MTIKAIVETTDGLPEPIQELYEPLEDGNGFRLKVEPAGGLELQDVSGLKSALTKERAEAERLRKEAQRYKDLDPDKAREALEKLEELEQIDPSKEADKIAAQKVEAATKQLLTKHEKELTSHKDRAEQLQRTVEKLMVDQVATSALSEAKGSVKLLLPHVQRNTRVVERDGKFAVEVIDDDGNVKINSKGEPITITELIAEMKSSDEFGRAFEASGQSGAGMARANGTGGGAASSRQRGNWTGSKTDRTAAIQNKFPDLPER